MYCSFGIFILLPSQTAVHLWKLGATELGAKGQCSNGNDRLKKKQSKSPVSRLINRAAW